MQFFAVGHGVFFRHRKELSTMNENISKTTTAAERYPFLRGRKEV
ncbi:MAG: hypothetical protein ACI4WS_09435 [Oscillospiraceae bacterium]